MKTVSEEYTPLHLAARFILPKTTQLESVEDDKNESDDLKMEGTTEADGCISFERQNSSEQTITYLLKECKGVDVSYSIQISGLCIFC